MTNRTEYVGLIRGQTVEKECGGKTITFVGGEGESTDTRLYVPVETKKPCAKEGVTYIAHLLFELEEHITKAGEADEALAAKEALTTKVEARTTDLGRS